MDIIYLLQTFDTVDLLGKIFSFLLFHGTQLNQDCIVLHKTKIRHFNQIGLNLILDEGFTTNIWWLKKPFKNPALFYFLLCQP